MKKLLFLIIAILSLTNVKASTYIEPVELNIDDEFYLKTSKHYKDNITYFEVSNILGTRELTKDELKQILSQTTTDNQNSLSIYTKLNIKVTPLKDTNFEMLENSPNYYLATSLDKWVYEDKIPNLEASSIAYKKSLNDQIDLYTGGIIYRSSTDDEWTTDIPDKEQLKGLTLEEQLAKLLKLDLSSNQDAVTEKYPELFSIYGISDGTSSVNRLDFYKASSENDNKIKTDKLKYIDTRYAIINYASDAKTVFNEIGLKQDNKFEGKRIIMPLMALMTLVIGTLIYINKDKLIKR